MSDLIDQFKKIKDKENLVTENLDKFFNSVNNFWSGYIHVNQRIDNLFEELNSIKNFKDKVTKEIKDFYLNTPDEKLPELIYWNHFKFYDDFDLLREIGYPKIRFMIPSLFEMLADINWPCSLPATHLLLEIGEPVIYHTEELFKSNDYELVSRAVSRVLINLSHDSIKLIKNELLKLIELFDYNDDEVSTYSFITLFQKKLITKEEIINLLKKDEKMNFVLIYSAGLIKDNKLLSELSNLIYDINSFDNDKFLNYVEKLNETDLKEPGKIIIKIKNNYG